MIAQGLLFQPTPFIGREKELAEIGHLLSDQACRLLTLVGTGGIGKTRLAIQAASDQHHHFRQGVYFVLLNAVDSPNLLASAVAGALQVSFASDEALRLQVIRYLSEKQALLVMDNFEHLLEGTDLLTDILQGSAGVKFLVTSRERLNMQEEWVFPVEGLSFPIARPSICLKRIALCNCSPNERARCKQIFPLPRMSRQ